MLGRLCTTPRVAKSLVIVATQVGNPRLMVTIAIELLIGCSSKLVAEVTARGDAFWKELDFVTSNMMLEIVADFSLVRAVPALTPPSSLSCALEEGTQGPCLTEKAA